MVDRPPFTRLAASVPRRSVPPAPGGPSRPRACRPPPKDEVPPTDREARAWGEPGVCRSTTRSRIRCRGPPQTRFVDLARGFHRSPADRGLLSLIPWTAFPQVRSLTWSRLSESNRRPIHADRLSCRRSSGSRRSRRGRRAVPSRRIPVGLPRRTLALRECPDHQLREMPVTAGPMQREQWVTGPLSCWRPCCSRSQTNQSAGPCVERQGGMPPNLRALAAVGSHVGASAAQGS